MSLSSQQLNAACETAVHMHRQGQLAAALQAYESILKVQPDHFVALHLSGLIAAQTGQPTKAIDLIGRALNVSPNVPSAYCNLSLAQKQVRDFEAALASLNRALALDPTLVVGYLNRAAVLMELKQAEAALGDYAKVIAIDARCAEAYFNRGCLLHDLGRTEAALADLRHTVSLAPQHGPAHLRCASVLRDLNRLPDALRSYDLAEACKCAGPALHLERGAVLARLGDYQAALRNFDTAVAQDPQLAQAHYNRGVVLAALRDQQGALDSYSRAATIDPHLTLAHLNRGVTLAELCRPADALECFDRALALEPHLAEAHFGKALVLLRLGDYETGWREYEWRWRNPSGSTIREKREWAAAQWRGQEPIAGRTILLHAEQGFGDTLQFCRYVPMVAARGARVILEVPAELLTLLRSLAGPAEVLVRGDPLPDLDLHCPLLSLPLAFGTTLDTIPSRPSYLRADAARVHDWAQRLGAPGPFRVGLVWAGQAKSSGSELKASFNARRDVPPGALAVLAESGARFFSLQTGTAAKSQLSELNSRWQGAPVIDCGSTLTDFADTAALIRNLDLVVTVDTATAHLAGALGTPVWILNREDACWRWLLERSDSPWYPSATLYRQSRAGAWDEVLDQVRADLQARVADHAAAAARP